MYRDKKIALVIPAYNEEALIADTLAGIDRIFDAVYVVDDCSPDGQNAVIERVSKTQPRVKLLKHSTNQGPGGAIITGYLKSAVDGNDLTVVVGADNQMDLKEVARFLDPIIDGKVDYTKGNRFASVYWKDTVSKMPRLRFFANWLITALTKIASGYYKVMDVVDGYTAISREAIEIVDWDRAWKGYGYPMDFLVRLNGYGLKILDIPRTAIYLPGVRQSQIKGFRYFRRVSPMLLKDFFWRLNFRYLYRDFHPLVLFFYIGIALSFLGAVLGGYLAWDWIFRGGFGVTASRSILAALMTMLGTQLLLFAMWMDMEEGR